MATDFFFPFKKIVKKFFNQKGIFGIVWEGLVPDFSTKEEILYLLVESENYFEAYK